MGTLMLGTGLMRRISSDVPPVQCGEMTNRFCEVVPELCLLGLLELQDVPIRLIEESIVLVSEDTVVASSGALT
jgi:hypothetical protein